MDWPEWGREFWWPQPEWGRADLIAAAVAGRQFGLALLWVVVVVALCKWLLNEGIARWHLATGESVIVAWATRLHRLVFWRLSYYLGISGERSIGFSLQGGPEGTLAGGTRSGGNLGGDSRHLGLVDRHGGPL